MTGVGGGAYIRLTNDSGDAAGAEEVRLWVCRVGEIKRAAQATLVGSGAGRPAGTKDAFLLGVGSLKIEDRRKRNVGGRVARG